MIRLSLLLLLIAIPVLSEGILDPAFETIPFSQWLAEPNNSHFHWTIGVPRATLSFHQRLLSRIEIELDGKDLQNRRDDGELVFFFQIMDARATRYQGHAVVDLSKLDPKIRDATLQLSPPAFFLPGDYQLSVALLDTRTREHATAQIKFRIARPSSSLLSQAWRALPPVEFIASNQSPESWYLPDIEGRVQWAEGLQTAAPLNIILNLSPSQPLVGARSTPSDGLPALLPTLKFLSETGPPGLSEHLELFDLARHRSVFQSDNEIQWPMLKAALSAASTASIDVHSLSNTHHDAQFFLTQVRRLLRASNKPSVLVILATPIAFASGEDLTPISTESLPPCRVFYIRYQTAPERFINLYARRRIRTPARLIPLIDQLAGTLKPLNPKLFDVETPEEITKALTEIRKALANN